jgi:ribosome biogenesis GTPase / thiamine phosphate phosphatase
VDLHVLGWNHFFERFWESNIRGGLKPARVVEEQKETYRVVGESGELAAEVTGRLRHEASDRSAFPAVGDWVAVDPMPAERKALIHVVLPRQTKLSRKVAGQRMAEQILVTNLDIAFVVMSLNADLNPRRLDRYLGAIWESGAQPVVLLSKADLCENRQTAAEEISAAAPVVNTHVLSAVTGEGLDALTPYMSFGKTVVLLGSSGVGKSTIINRLLGSDTQKTLEIRSSDDRGRHATTYRRLFLMPAGGVLIDTPGMREFQLWDADTGLDETFVEIGALSAHCRFRDCSHETEPGCAVLEAIASGSLDPDRIMNYRKLKRELEFQERKRDPAAQAELRKRWKQIHKAQKRLHKSKG